MKHRPPTLTALATTLALTACGGSQEAAAPAARRPALRVRVAPVAVKDVVYQIKALGSLEAEDRVQVTAQVEGVASDVGFHEGDRVTPRTVLLRIDPARYQLEAERAGASLEQAQAERVRAEADLRRREALAHSQLLSAEELTRSQSDSARLSAAVEVARAAAGIARQNVERSEVRSPIAGVIDTRSDRHGRVRAHRDGARHDRRHEPAAPALQGVRDRVARRARGRRGRRSAWLRSGRVSSPRGSITSAASPTRPPGRSRCWPG